MSPDIDFEHIQPQETPDVQFELDREGGLSGLPVDAKRILVLAYGLAAGSIADGVLKQVTSSAKGQEYWGEGSMMAVMIEAAIDVNPKAEVYGVSFAEDAGADAATGTLVFVGNASGSGTVKFSIGGRSFQFGVAKDDTPTEMGDALVAAVAQKSNLPFTVANAAGTVTATARNACPEGNSIRMHGEITAGITTTFTVASALSGGLTAGDPTDTLANLVAWRFHLIALGTGDATTMGVMTTHQEEQSEPAAKKPGIGAIGAAGTRSAAETLADGDDSYNSQIFWLQEAENPSFELVARLIAHRSRYAANVGVIDQVIKGVLPPYDETKWPGDGDIEAAIKGGVSPVRPLRNGTCEIVRSVLTRQTAPIAYRDHNQEEIWHYTCEFLIGLVKMRIKGKRLKSASPAGRPGTVTPKLATGILNEGLIVLDKRDYVQGVKESIAAGNNKAQINSVETTTRLDSMFDFIPIGLVILSANKGTFKRPQAELSVYL